MKKFSQKGVEIFLLVEKPLNYTRMNTKNMHNFNFSEWCSEISV